LRCKPLEVDGKPFESVDQRITFADSARGDADHQQSTSQKSRGIDELPSGG
jgi:hypothetical protein